MNIYDALNNLTNAIKNSPEYIRYKDTAAIIDADPTYSEMMKDFMSLQFELSALQMLGQQPTEEQIEHFNTMYTTISGIGVASEFLQAQMYFSKIVEDISKEITKVIDIDAKFMDVMPDMPNDNEE